MKSTIIFFSLAIFAIFLTSCSQVEVFCPEDARMCPDGSSVVRVAPNCEFQECPSSKLDGRVCTKEYRPVCGDDGITYGNKCMAGNRTIAYVGECTNTIVGNDSDSHGCIASAGYVWNETMKQCVRPWEVETHVCSEQEKQAQICTMEYNPVCGNDGNTYGNKCGACSAGIDSYKFGECD